MQISLLNVIFGRCTAETLVTLNVSNLYINKDETILRAKLMNLSICEEIIYYCSIVEFNLSF